MILSNAFELEFLVCEVTLQKLQVDPEVTALMEEQNISQHADVHLDLQLGAGSSIGHEAAHGGIL